MVKKKDKKKPLQRNPDEVPTRMHPDRPSITPRSPSPWKSPEPDIVPQPQREPPPDPRPQI